MNEQSEQLQTLPCPWGAETARIQRLMDEQDAMMMNNDDGSAMIIEPVSSVDTSWIRIEDIPIEFRHPNKAETKRGKISVRYCPNQFCVTIESIVDYIKSWVTVGAYFEEAVDKILEVLWEALSPMYLSVEGAFAGYGASKILVERNRDGSMG